MPRLEPSLNQALSLNAAAIQVRHLDGEEVTTANTRQIRANSATAAQICHPRE